jgi:hypothetical protein
VRRCYPPSDARDRLKTAILEAFRRRGGDSDAVRRTYMMLRDRGAEGLRIRAAVVALAPAIRTCAWSPPILKATASFSTRSSPMPASWSSAWRGSVTASRTR